MTAFDFAPLSRSMIGFDRMFDLLQQASQLQLVDNNPPYNIEKTDEDRYRITLAVAGYQPDELAVSWQPNRLLVSGKKSNQPAERDDDGYLYRGIADQGFQRSFELADHVRVADAQLSDGLLVIELLRELPEAMRPRRIEIAGPSAPQIEQKAA